MKNTLTAGLRSARHAALACLMGLAAVAASAQTAAVPAKRSYLVVSLLGDSITAVTQQSRTGTRISRNAQETLALPEGIFDKPVLMSVESAIKAAEPAADITVLAIGAVKSLGDAEKFSDGSELRLPAKMDTWLKQVNTTHLLLVTPHRAEANIKGDRDGIGSGTLQGLGFFIDRELKVKNVETGEYRDGYLAPYTYFKLQLVDRASGKIVRQQLVTEAVMLGDGRAGDPWEVMSTQDKVTTLRGMLNEQIALRMPKMLASDTAPAR